MTAQAKTEIDFNFGDTSPEKISDCLKNYGAVILRNALDRRYVAGIKSNVEAVYAAQRKLLTGDADAAAFFSGYDQITIDNIGNGDIAAQLYEDKFGDSASMLSFAKNRKFKEVCALTFRRGRYHLTGTNTLMTVRPNLLKPEGNATAGIDLHTDGMYFNDLIFSLTVWIPIDPCGEDAPGLEVVIADHLSVRRYADYDSTRPAPTLPTWNLHRYRPGAFNSNDIRKHYGPDRWVTPKFDRGDVMIFTNWAIHGTYRTPEMTKARSAIQFRIDSEAFNPASSTFFGRLRNWFSL